MDKLFIRDLKTRCIIGLNEEERINKQDVIINIVLYGDLTEACCSDNIRDTIDYKEIKKNILFMVENSSFLLIEKLAGEIASVCFSDPKVLKADVTIDKPGALRYARSVAVEISRERLC